MAVSTYQTIDTVYSADSVEWCPLPGYEKLMFSGTYQLQEQSQDEEADQANQVRIGRLTLYSLNTGSSPQLDVQSETDMPGILDIKWSYVPIADHPTIALVNSVGQLRVYNVKEDNTVAMVTEAELEPQSLGLSLEWNNMKSCSDLTQITSSDSSGHVHVHQFTNSGLALSASWKAHDYEAWITAFNQSDTNIVYTGGDDCKFKGWDLRSGTDSPVFTSKRHSMGVCSIQSSPVQAHTLATGSYDEHLLIWDTRSMRCPVSDIILGGGVWRVKWEPVSANHILTATMYNGFHVIDTQVADLSIVCHYKEHKSLAYGADWYRITTDKQVENNETVEARSSKSNRNSETVDSSENISMQKELCASIGQDRANATAGKIYTLATCSFYDHLLKLWTLKS